MKQRLKSLLMAFPLVFLIPSAAWAYQEGLRDPETGLDCNQQKQILKVAGADTHPHQIKKIHQILRRCSAKEKDALNTISPLPSTPARD